METMMVKLASERVLSADDLATLGRFRQDINACAQRSEEMRS